MRIKCEQCEKVFVKATREACLASMRMHVGRKHGNIRNAVKRDATGSKDPQRAKRLAYQKEWRRRRSQMLRHSQNGHASTVGFCPRCGMNLELLATALAVVNKA